MADSIYDIPVNTLAGDEDTLHEGRDKVMLIVNTASKCGFTPQYKGLEELHKDYADQGLLVVGFPCNQFGKQEPGDSDDIQQFCEINYGVTFPVYEKVDVNGPDAHPIFQKLCSEAPGLLGSQRIKWNFTKFLVDRSGKTIERFAPTTEPKKMRAQIESLLVD